MSEDPRPEQLRALLDLQQTDGRIRRLRHQLDDLPEQRELDEAEARATAVREEHDGVRVDLDRVTSESRRIEGEVDLLRQRKNAEHARMYSGDITSPKELQSLRAEIDSTERRISEHEDQLLEAMERVEALESRAAALAEEQQALEGKVTELSDARDRAAEGLLAELAELEVARDGQRADIPADLLERYDAKHEKLGGMAVGELRDGMCTACRIELPYAEVNELLDGPPLATCPQCGRLLVVIST